MSFSDAGVFIAVIVNIAALLVAYDKIKSFKGEKAKELHSRYAQIKPLAEKIESNYSEILIILSGITRADLSIEEIQWFIVQPRAFLKLEEYGSVAGRYCKIDLDKGEFVFTDRVATRKKRIFERLKILGIGLFILAVVSVVWVYIVKDTDRESILYIALSFWFAYFLLVLWGTNLMLSTLSKAKNLIGLP